MYDASLSYEWDGGRQAQQGRGGGGPGFNSKEWRDFYYRRGGNTKEEDGGYHYYGRWGESDLKRREREAREAAQRAEDERLWWEYEKSHAERMKTQFRATKARTESNRAERVTRKLSGFWQTKRGVLWTDVAVTAAAIGFVTGAGVLFVATGKKNREKERHAPS